MDWFESLIEAFLELLSDLKYSKNLRRFFTVNQRARILRQDLFCELDPYAVAYSLKSGYCYTYLF
ncbi:MAG: hypothetical protein ACOC4M_13300, partial [Promethearchaeia archaeon]